MEPDSVAPEAARHAVNEFAQVRGPIQEAGFIESTRQNKLSARAFADSINEDAGRDFIDGKLNDLKDAVFNFFLVKVEVLFWRGAVIDGDAMRPGCRLCFREEANADSFKLGAPQR